jgi:hypothetical protein
MSTSRWKFANLGVVVLALALQGCFSVPVNLRSDPAGATVLANGEVIGTTPMRVYADRVFPHKRNGIDWRREGTLTLERPGCKPETMEVDNDTLKRSLTVDLECRPDAPGLTTPVTATRQTVATQQPAARTAVGTAERLRELEDLRGQGLISDDEYRSIRTRILEGL